MNNQMLEAIKELEILNINPIVKAEFVNNRTLFKSCEDGSVCHLNESEIAIVKDFEKEWNGIVYHVVYTNTSFGKMLSLLYASKYPDDWKNDKDCMHMGMAHGYVKNLDNDNFSESGYIHFRRMGDGIIRIA